MQITTLVFDIGGTVFDWNTPVIKALQNIVPDGQLTHLNFPEFSKSARARFMELNAKIVRGQLPWQSADQILATVMTELCVDAALRDIPTEALRQLEQSWRRMPAWSGAREAIARLRERYVVVPLTILSCPMAIGSSRKNGIVWDSILSCDLLGYYKPDPRCYARAAEILDCQPREMMMVASHPSDLRAAISASYRSAYVLPQLEDPGDDYTDTGFASEFDVVAADFTDLTELLLGL